MNPSLPPSPPTEQDRRGRRAVSLIFFLNGISFCAILPRYPEIMEHIGLSYTEFGLAVGIGPLGGLVAGLGAAALMRRFGSARTAVCFQIAASCAHLLVYTSQSWAWLAGSLLLATAVDAITDIAMNAHGMRVERRYRRSIMNSYHGWWSLGAVSGGLVGAACAQLAVPLWIQGLSGVFLFGALALLASRWMLPGEDHSERVAPPVVVAPDDSAAAVARPRRGVRRHLTGRALAMLAALGMVLVFAGASEDAGNTWGAQYMKSTFGATPFLAGMAFVALQGAQTIGRFTGDAVVDRLGDRLTARLGAVISAVGMALALLVPSPVTSMIGFACVGWGIATLFPAAFRAADELPGVTPGVGITMVGWLARIGFFVAPPVVGALADAFTLRYALWLVPLYAAGLLIFSGVLEGKNPHGRHGERPAAVAAE